LAEDCADSERSSEMRRKITIAASVCVVLLGAVLAIAVLLDRGGVQPVFGEEAEDLLAAVQLGCETAASRVSTSSGQVTVHKWYWRSNGELIETDSVYTVASTEERFKAVADVTYVTNEATVPESQPGQQPVAPGTVLKEELAYDGERIVSYKPAEQRATMAGLDSRAGGDLTMMKVTVMSPGHGVPTSLVTAPYLPPRYTRTGPHVVGREVVNGDECIVVEFVDTRTDADGAEVAYDSRLWINPQRGFTTFKSESSARGGVFGEEALLADMEMETREYADDLWGISRVQQEQYALDDSGRRYLQLRTITTFAADYALNAPVTDDMLTVTLPSGTKVYNELLDASYVVP
jgi:hypothetical protein